MTQKKILLLRGENTSLAQISGRLSDSFRGVQVTPVSAEELLQAGTLNDQVQALVLPGIVGDDSPYSTLLGARGNQVIRDYVTGGGVFVGVCAGAYYACREIRYDPPWLAHPKTSRPGLDFFNGLAAGPVGHAALKGDRSWYSDCTIVPVSFAGADGQAVVVGIAYGNGPVLKSFNAAAADDAINVIAHYADSDLPAVATRHIGAGLAVFMGVLPYIGHDRAMSGHVVPALAEINNKLALHEPERQVLWDRIVSTIKTHNINLGRATPYLIGKPR